MGKIFILILAYLLAQNISVSENRVFVINVKAGIGPGISDYIQSSLKYAEEQNAEAFIIELNTPGGLLETTRDIVHTILDAKVPVVVYVHPSGARAGSAGAFITLAAHIAVMTPGTNIGAAHPVGIGGQSDSSAMFDKVTNDAAAFMRTIAQKRGRNVDWAERAVRESISATEQEALNEGVIDLICPNIDSLLKAIDGWEVETYDGIKKINLKNAKVERVEKNWKQELLTFLSDPNIAYIFLMLAIYGILFELYNPGSIFPGVIGVISAVIAGYSLQMLPVNIAGLALIILAIIMFILEIKIQSYGLLTIGGIVSFLVGSIMLIDSPFEFLDISLSIIITGTILTALFFLLVIGLGIKAQTKRRATGVDALIGQEGIAITDISPGNPGKVRVSGEIWKAVSNFSIKENEPIIVKKVEGLKLVVEPLTNA